MYVLLVVPSRHSMMILAPLLQGRLGLFGFDELLSVIDRSHDVVVARLLHHLHLRVHTFNLAIAALALVVYLLSALRSLVVPGNSRQIVRRRLLSLGSR